MSDDKKVSDGEGDERYRRLVERLIMVGQGGLRRSGYRPVADILNQVEMTPSLKPRAVARAVKEARKKVGEGEKDDPFADLHTVERKRAEFLIYPYIPRASLTMLDGDPGMGKSLVTAHIGAVVSTGGKFADRETVEQGRVLYMSPEDEADRILKPRLEEHGADDHQIRFMEDPFLLDGDGIRRLRMELLRYRPKIVFIDPLSAFIPADTDTFRANEVRGFMRPLASLASELDVAFMVVRHLRKASTESAIQRGQGSMDFIASVRSGLLVAKRPQEPDGRVLAHAKANYSREGASLAFEVIAETREAIPRIKWLGEVAITANQLVQGGGQTSAEEIAEIIANLLAKGPVKARDAMKYLLDRGYPERSIDRAKKLARVESGRGPGAEWRLAE